MPGTETPNPKPLNPKPDTLNPKNPKPSKFLGNTLSIGR